MSKPRWQNLFFAFSVLSFFCLLLSGGSRLIASPEDGEMKEILPAQSWLEASITCPPSAAEQNSRIAGRPEPIDAEGNLFCIADRQEGAHPPMTDANGNVLRHASYMRAVYQVFALGDGFV